MAGPTWQDSRFEENEALTVILCEVGELAQLVIGSEPVDGGGALDAVELPAGFLDQGLGAFERRGAPFFGPELGIEEVAVGRGEGLVADEVVSLGCGSGSVLVAGDGDVNGVGAEAG